MKRPADPDLLWRYYHERGDTAEALAGLVERAAAITRKARAEYRGPGDLTRTERGQLSELLEGASRLRAKLRGDG